MPCLAWRGVVCICVCVHMYECLLPACSVCVCAGVHVCMQQPTCLDVSVSTSHLVAGAPAAWLALLVLP